MGRIVPSEPPVIYVRLRDHRQEDITPSIADRRAWGSLELIDQTVVAGALLRHLAGRWPEMVTLQPGQLGLIGNEGARAFVKAVRELADQGLLSYEALIGGVQDPRALGATVTTRGRASAITPPAAGPFRGGAEPRP